MKKFLNVSLALLLAASVVPVQAMEVQNADDVTFVKDETHNADDMTFTNPAIEELEIVSFETKKEENKLLKSAKDYAFPVAIAGLAATLFYIRAFKPETVENANPTAIRNVINKISKQVNNLFALSYKYKDPIHDTISVCLLASVGKAALCGNLTDMFNNASKNLPFGMGNFMKAKEPKDCAK